MLFVVACTPPPTKTEPPVTGDPIQVFTYGNVSEADRTKNVHALEGAISFASQEFGQMPLTTVRLRLYENEEWFARGLVLLAGYSEEEAARFARLFAGTVIERDNTIMVRVNAVRDPLASAFVVINELVHLLQNSWAGSVHWIDVWLAQGQSTFYSARHVELIAGPHAHGFYRRTAIAAVRERWADLSAFSITQVDPHNWMDTVERLGWAQSWSIIYAYTFLAYDYLVTRTSLQAVFDYFARLKRGTPQEEAFLAAFKMTESDFDVQLREHVRTLVGR